MSLCRFVASENEALYVVLSSSVEKCILTCSYVLQNTWNWSSSVAILQRTDTYKECTKKYMYNTRVETNLVPRSLASPIRDLGTRLCRDVTRSFKMIIYRFRQARLSWPRISENFDLGLQ